jgi:dCTP deaminase
MAEDVKRPKPHGVGINKISMRELVRFGMAKGHIEEDDLIDGVPMIGALLPDWAIREFVTIEDFVDYDDCPAGVVSYGLTSSGYDIRVGGFFKVFTNANCETVSPRNISPGSFLDFDLTGHNWHMGKCTQCGAERDSPKGRSRCVPDVPPRDIAKPPESVPRSIKIPPNSFALAETVELLHIPRNINCLCLGKSTYARCGIIMNFTPFEPGWRGIVTVEISNSTPLPVEIFAYQGIGQAQFSLTVGKCEKSYADKKNAKYQDQKGLTLPSVK